MKSLLVFGCLAYLASAMADPQDDDISVRAPSNFKNCGCQCVSIQIEDNNGNFHGNCER